MKHAVLALGLCRTSRLLLCLALLAGTHSAWAQMEWCDKLAEAPADVVSRISELASNAATDKPNPVSLLKSEGLLPTDPIAVRTNAARRDFTKVRALAYGWRLSAKEPFLLAARDYLVKWANIYHTNSNPIDEAALPVLVEGYSLIRSALDGGDRAIIDSWLGSIYGAHIRELRRQVSSSALVPNNWQSHRINIAASIAFAKQDIEGLAEVLDYYRFQVFRSIGSDGVTFDFLQRDSIGYVVYGMTPLLNAALLFQASRLVSFDDVSQMAGRVFSAIDWVVPYADGRKVHIEFNRRRLAIDERRAAAGVPGYAREAWRPEGAQNMFWLAAYLKPDYLQVARTLAGTPSIFLIACRGTPSD